jgi:hypothetical protein
MPIKEVVTKQTIIPLILSAATSAHVVGAIIDTADYDNGVYFAVMCSAYSSGTWTLLLEESASATFATSNVVASKNRIHALPIITAVNVATAIGSVTGIAKCGVHGTKRYLRATITETSAGTATLACYAIVNPEIAATAAII